MRLRNRLQQLQRRLAALSPSQPEDEHDVPTSQAIDVWEDGGCQGPLPPAGPCPRKYRQDEWLAIHRCFCGLILRSKGLPLPQDFTEEERREVDGTRATFARIDPAGNLSLRQQADLAPYRDVVERFLCDPGGGIVPAVSGRGESS
jgi:hypothetical protein